MPVQPARIVRRRWHELSRDRRGRGDRIGLFTVPLLAAALLLNTCTMPVVFHARPGRDRCAGAEGYSASGARTFSMRSDWLNRNALWLNSPAGREERAALIAAAKRAIVGPPETVVAKSASSPSGDPHDYLSFPTYYWPDATRPGKLVRIDGRRNPLVDSDRYDHARLFRFIERTRTLALAYRYTGDRRYAEGAARLIRVWFVLPTTRMNPNFRYAQFQPDLAVGNGYGIIDGWRLIWAVDAIGLIARSGALAPQDLLAVRKWFADYLGWLSDSPEGRKEAARSNNHKTHYEIQRIGFALFTRQAALAHRFATDAASLVGTQIAADGDLPLETERAKKSFYLVQGIQALLTLAGLAECAGVDLWRATTWRSGGIRSAVDNLGDIVTGVRAPPDAGFAAERGPAKEALMAAAWAYDDPRYALAARGYDELSPNFALAPFPAATLPAPGSEP